MSRETAVVENSSIFWSLLDSLSQPELAKYDHAKEYYEKSLRILQNEYMTDPVVLGSFELGLSLHTAAPKIEAYYQFYETSVVPSLTEYDESCQSWVHWRGKQICRTKDLEVTLRQSTGEQRYVETKLNLL
jgi:UDP-glucose:glycoprotein glucosyltransferase